MEADSEVNVRFLRRSKLDEKKILKILFKFWTFPG